MLTEICTYVEAYQSHSEGMPKGMAEAERVSLCVESTSPEHDGLRFTNWRLGISGDKAKVARGRQNEWDCHVRLCKAEGVAR